MNKKPNVIIIMADQLRADALGEHTPNINSLRKEGVAFTRAYCASPLCVPARGSFFTGRYPNETGSIINPWEPLDRDHGDVRKDIPNLYRMMEGEWDSWHTGKQHLYTAEGKMEKSENSKTKWINTEEHYAKFLKESGKRAPGGKAFKGILPEMALGRVTRMKQYSVPNTGLYEEGFDYFFDGFFAKGAIDAIRNRDKSRPFLLNAMFLAPHPPFDIPEPWYSMYEKANLPENVGRWCKDQSPLQLYNLTGALGSRYSREDWEKVWPVYMGLVALLDHCIGMMINELKKEGIYDDTLILFTSDHGEMLGAHCLWQKMCMYEEAVRVPLFIKFPKEYNPKIRETDLPVSHIDVLPTLCDFLGIDKPEKLSGISLLPVLEGIYPDRKAIFIQFDGNGARGNFQRCVIQGDYKLVVDMFKDEYYIELYKVKDDTQEMENLAFDPMHGDLVEEMIASLRNHMTDTEDMLEIPSDMYDKFLIDYRPFRK